jgi:integrase
MQRGWMRKRGSVWSACFVVYENGKRKQRSRGGFRTKKEAQAFLTETLGQLQHGDLVEPTRLTVADYLTEHWLPLAKRSIRPSTWDSYNRTLRNHVIPRIGDVNLQNLTAAHLDRLYTELLNGGRKDSTVGGLSPKTVRYIHTTLHKALKDAERKQLVTRNVAGAADAPKNRTAGSSELMTWSGEEVGIFLNALRDHRLYAAYVVAASTGMRRGEVLGLRWRDVDLQARRLAVRQTITTVNYKIEIGTPKTAKGRRSIAIDTTTVQALRDHRKRQWAERAELGEGFADQDLVFCQITGGPVHPDFFSQTFDRTVARLGMRRIRLHDLRHTHATLGLAAGIPPKIMSDRLGHATVAFTQDVYMHAIPQMESDAADQIADLIFTARTERDVASALTNLPDDETIENAPTRIEGLIAGWSSGSSLGS